MEYRSPVRDQFLRRHIDQSECAERLKAALSEFDKGNAHKGHETLRPLLDISNAYALLLASLFSTEAESEQAFLRRHLAQLEAAADLGDSVARYSLGVYFDQGELLDCDTEKALDYYRKSAEAGMPQAMFVYGVMQFYGTGGALLQKSAGLLMVQAAASAGVDEAIDFLSFLKSKSAEAE